MRMTNKAIERVCQDYLNESLAHALALDDKESILSFLERKVLDSSVAVYEKAYPWLIKD